MSRTASEGRPGTTPRGVTDHDRPVDQDRMRQHEIKDFVVGPLGIDQIKFGIGRAFLAQQIAWFPWRRSTQ